MLPEGRSASDAPRTGARAAGGSRPTRRLPPDPEAPALASPAKCFQQQRIRVLPPRPACVDTEGCGARRQGAESRGR